MVLFYWYGGKIDECPRSREFVDRVIMVEPLYDEFHHIGLRINTSQKKSRFNHYIFCCVDIADDMINTLED